MQPPWPGSWRYTLGASCGWLMFLTAVVAIGYGRQVGWPAPWLIALACLPALIAALQFLTAYRLLARQDEFVRALFAKRLLVAGAVVIVLATAWSGAELVGAPHLGAWLLYPLLWGMFGALTPIIKDARA